MNARLRSFVLSDQKVSTKAGETHGRLDFLVSFAEFITAYS